MTEFPRPPVGLLVSGGLDSGILLGRLLEQGSRVQPFYVRCGLHWEAAELAALRRLCRWWSEDRPSSAAAPAGHTEAARSPDRGRGTLAPLVVFEMPLADVYGDHWSITGREVPGGSTPDEAVYLPGRNALLVIKAAVWCRLHGIEELNLAPLGSNPFSDAGPEFFGDFQAALNRALGGSLVVRRPFAHLHKRDVMSLGRGHPLELTFSCIAPVGELHCGHCNKCAERREAFHLIDMSDPTRYAESSP